MKKDRKAKVFNFILKRYFINLCKVLAYIFSIASKEWFPGTVYPFVSV